MATIVTRAGKGSPLTHNEVDANFTNLNTDKLETSGGTLTGNLSFGDNDKAIFGAGSDLQIYHDGSHSVIRDVGTGNLYLQTNGTSAIIGSTTGTTVFKADFTDGVASLHYSNGEKLATTATGVDVTGTVTADGLTVESSTSNYPVKISGFATTVPVYLGAVGNNLRAYVGNLDRMNIAENGDISFYEDTGTTPKFFWDASAENLTIGSHDGSGNLRIGALSGVNQDAVINMAATNSVGSIAPKVELTTTYDSSGGGNGSAFSVSTRNGLGLNERLRIDASGNVGIGTNSPTDKLSIIPANNFTGLTIDYASGSSQLTLKGNAASQQVIAFGDSVSSTSGRISYDNSIDALRINTNGSERMRIDNSGRVGIGTSSPAHKLDIYHTSSFEALRIQTNQGGALVRATDSSGIVDMGAQGGSWVARTGGVVRIAATQAGNVGIGTTSPAHKLDVNGTVGATTVDFGDWTITESGGSLYFATGGVNKMKLDASGNLDVVGSVNANATIS